RLLVRRQLLRQGHELVVRGPQQRPIVEPAGGVAEMTCQVGWQVEHRTSGSVVPNPCGGRPSTSVPLRVSKSGAGISLPERGGSTTPLASELPDLGLRHEGDRPCVRPSGSPPPVCWRPPSCSAPSPPPAASRKTRPGCPTPAASSSPPAT